MNDQVNLSFFNPIKMFFQYKGHYNVCFIKVTLKMQNANNNQVDIFFQYNTAILLNINV